MYFLFLHFDFFQYDMFFPILFIITKTFSSLKHIYCIFIFHFEIIWQKAASLLKYNLINLPLFRLCWEFNDNLI